MPFREFSGISCLLRFVRIAFGLKVYWKVGRVTECAGLEIRYTPFGYRGFESLTFRFKQRNQFFLELISFCLECRMGFSLWLKGKCFSLTFLFFLFVASIRFVFASFRFIPSFRSSIRFVSYYLGLFRCSSVFIRSCPFLLGSKETDQRKEPPPRSPLKGGTNHSPSLVHSLRMTGIHKPVRTVVACAIALSNIFMARPAPSHHCSFYSFTSHIKATNVEYLIYWQH